jgi:hypothetical protein
MAAGGVTLFAALVLGFFLRARPDLADSLSRAFGYPFGVRTNCGGNASTSLKTISSAQADFRANDRDANGRKDFWRGDIAGLYTLVPKDVPESEPERIQRHAIKLIELSVASADDRPVTDLNNFAVRSSKNGYWFRAIRHADEKTLSPDRFAACAFPDSRYAGKWTYILDENNVIYRKELGSQRGVEIFPEDPITGGWTRLD